MVMYYRMGHFRQQWAILENRIGHFRKQNWPFEKTKLAILKNKNWPFRKQNWPFQKIKLAIQKTIRHFRKLNWPFQKTKFWTLQATHILDTLSLTIHRTHRTWNLGDIGGASMKCRMCQRSQDVSCEVYDVVGPLCNAFHNVPINIDYAKSDLMLENPLPDLMF